MFGPFSGLFPWLSDVSPWLVFLACPHVAFPLCVRSPGVSLCPSFPLSQRHQSDWIRAHTKGLTLTQSPSLWPCLKYSPVPRHQGRALTHEFGGNIVQAITERNSDFATCQPYLSSPCTQSLTGRTDSQRWSPGRGPDLRGRERGRRQVSPALPIGHPADSIDRLSPTKNDCGDHRKVRWFTGAPGPCISGRVFSPQLGKESTWEKFHLHPGVIWRDLSGPWWCNCLNTLKKKQAISTAACSLPEAMLKSEKISDP